MARLDVSAVLAAIIICFALDLRAQTDDIHQATGLPIAVGTPVIYGRVTLRGLTSEDRKPTIYVSLFEGGSQVDRMRANERGYFYFLRTAVNGATLVYEINDIEVSRQVLMANLGNRTRQDIEVDWKLFSKVLERKPGTVSIKDSYERTPENERLLENALAAAKQRNEEQASRLLKDLLEKDPNDFVAWTELGTIYFNGGRIPEAENAYDRALKLKPGFMVALMNMGKMQLSQKRPDKAVVTFTAAINSDPKSADAFHYLGESYLQIKVGSKAVIALNEALRLAPIEKADVHLRLATLYNAAGQKSLAAREYKLLLEKKPDHPEKKKLQKFIDENEGK